MLDLKNPSFYSLIQLFDSRSDFCFVIAISYLCFNGGGGGVAGISQYSLKFIDKVWKYNGNKYVKQ